jgi:hypothetical protein
MVSLDEPSQPQYDGADPYACVRVCVRDVQPLVKGHGGLGTGVSQTKVRIGADPRTCVQYARCSTS